MHDDVSIYIFFTLGRQITATPSSRSDHRWRAGASSAPLSSASRGAASSPTPASTADSGSGRRRRRRYVLGFILLLRPEI
jgi:hypothetical protein